MATEKDPKNKRVSIPKSLRADLQKMHKALHSWEAVADFMRNNSGHTSRQVIDRVMNPKRKTCRRGTLDLLMNGYAKWFAGHIE